MLYQKVQLDLTAVSEVQGENQRRHSFPKCFHRSDNGYRKYINTLNNYLKSNAEMRGAEYHFPAEFISHNGMLLLLGKKPIFGDYTVL